MPMVIADDTNEYLAKNPNGRVPTLEEDGFVLWESPAILKYRSAKRPERCLCGADTKTKALSINGSVGGSAGLKPPSMHSPGSC